MSESKAPKPTEYPCPDSGHFSEQAEYFEVGRNEYGDEIPESSKGGPKYSANKGYAGTGDSTHSDK